MTNKVVSLPGNRVPSAEPNQEVIDMIETMLDHAKSGNLQSFVGTGFMADGARIAMWADTEQHVYKMLGAIAWMHAEYLHRHTDKL